MVEQASPLLVGGGLAKADGVIFKRLPLNEKQVSLRTFDAEMKLVRHVAVRSRGDVRGLAEGSLERVRVAWTHVEDCKL
ncbi:MAG: hypothetical protein HW416_2659 [Chloroflexi bacterium]|nr:hypothetical protein [Chloroflexota bacterium]